MWRSPRTCALTAKSCGANCGTRRMSKFLGRTPCAASERGHRTLPPIHRRPSRNGDRGSDRSEDPHREATRGVGPVTGSAGLESQSGRGGRHPASSSEGLLVLIPSRGPHPCFRVQIGLPVRERNRSAHEVPHREATRGVGPVTGATGAEDSWPEGWDVTTPPRPKAPWCSYHQVTFNLRSPAGPAGGWIGAGQERRSTPRGDSRRRPGDGGGGVGEPCGRGGRHHFRLKAEGPL